MSKRAAQGGGAAGRGGPTNPKPHKPHKFNVSNPNACNPCWRSAVHRMICDGARPMCNQSVCTIQRQTKMYIPGHIPGHTPGHTTKNNHSNRIQRKTNKTSTIPKKTDDGTIPRPRTISRRILPGTRRIVSRKTIPAIAAGTPTFDCVRDRQS